MVFFKRLSRSRSNSQSYVDNYDSRHDSKTNSQTYDDKYATDYDDPQGVPVSAHSNKAPQLGDPLPKETADASAAQNMYARRDRPVEVGHQYPNNSTYQSPPVSAGARGMSNGYEVSPQSAKHEAAPNLLLEAFNQAIRPYNEKVENLESEIADLRAYIEALERQRNDVHAWIDKRGLRPGTYESLPHPKASRLFYDRLCLSGVLRVVLETSYARSDC